MKFLKTLLLLLFLLLFSGCIAYARDLTFTWDRNPEPDVITYRLETSDNPDAAWTTAGRTVGNSIEIEVKGMPNTTLFVRVFAINTAGLESEPSEVLRVDPDRPSAPGKPRIKIVLQSSADLKQWQDDYSKEEAAEAKRFYRTVIAAVTE